ncbi:MAG: BTAD domain-containing putative transcriptional regulator [Anaerolineales bacterium]
MDTIHANLPRKLIAVIAPAGYGKTTLLSDFASHTELPVCWLRLTEADRDVMRMAGVLQASLVSRFRRLQRTLRVDAMANAEESAVAAAFARVIGSAVADPFVLIVDDVHLVNPSPSVMRFWSKFIDVQPENMTVIMAGREVPNLPLDYLLEKNRVAGIGPLELSLTTAELAELCQRAMGIALDEAEAERLQKETGGWVMGVLLSGALPVAGLGVLVQSPRPMVYDYLAAVVLNRQTPSMRKFLLHSSVLPVMTAEACDEVLGRRDSGRVLNRALRNGLFLSSTGERPKTYEYHPQFREFLLAMLKEEDSRGLRRLRGRAGEYLARSESIEAAVDLYLDAGLNGRAARLVHRYARTIRRAGKRETLERWTLAFKDHTSAWAELTIEIGTALADKGLVEDARASFDAAGSVARREGFKALLVRSLCGRAQAAFIACSYAEAREFANRAERLSRGIGGIVRADAIRYTGITGSMFNPRNARYVGLVEQARNIARRQGDLYATVVFSADLAETVDRLGLWKRTIQELKGLERYLPSEGLGRLRPQILLNIAFANLCQGRLEVAFGHADLGAKEALEAGNLHMHLNNTSMKATVLGIVGRADEALDILDEADSHSHGTQVVPLRAWLLDSRIDVLRWNGRYAEAKLATHRLNALPLPMELVGWGQTRNILAENSESPKRLATALGEHLRTIGDKSIPSQIAFSHWFLAKANFQSGNLNLHLSSLSKALRGALSPMVGVNIAIEASQDEKYVGALLARHPDDESLRRVAELGRMFQNARNRPEQFRHVSIGHTIEVCALLPVLSVRKNGMSIRLRPLDRDVLAILLDGEVVSSEYLAEAIWPDATGPKQRTNLHSAVYRLRGLLGGQFVESHGSAYRISIASRLRYDVTEFQSAVAQVKAEIAGNERLVLGAGRRAMQIYGRGFLSSATSSWARNRRAELERQFLQIATIHAEQCLAMHSPLEAEAVLTQAMAIDSSNDRLVEMALTAIAQQGKWGDLSRIYKEYSLRLREDLGLDPSIGVRKKYESLLMGSPVQGGEKVSGP